MATKSNVIFLGGMNSARTQMAEALLRHHAGDQFEVFSAGVQPSELNPHAVRAMDEIGIDIRQQQSKGSKAYMGRMFFRYIIILAKEDDELYPQALWAQSGVKLHWPFDDPASATGTDEEIMAKFCEVRDQIDQKIKAWLEQLATEKVDV